MSNSATLFGRGYLGTAIYNHFTKNGIKTYWYAHDTKEHIIIGDIIINAAGFTGFPNIDECEIKRKECIEGNVVWPIFLENRYKNYPILHLSSGCIYQGYKSKGKGWTESDPANFSGSFYSLCKTIEQEHLDLEYNYLLRIRMPFAKDNSDRNYLNKLRKYPKLVDGENSLSCLDDVVRVVLFFAQSFPEPGIYNVCNEGHIGAKEIADMMGLQKEWFTREEFDNFVSTPKSFTTLNTDKLQKIFPIRDVREAIRSCL